MARKKLTSKRRVYPKSIVLILDSGHDFFGDLDGGIESNLDLLCRAWADPEIRQQVIARCEAKGVKPQPWATRKFGT